MNYATDYPLPDFGIPPADVHQMIREALQERLLTPGDFTSWEWERRLFAGELCWELRTFPVPDPTRPPWCLVLERAINTEIDPDKALVLLWRYRGRKKETMRSLQGLTSAATTGVTEPGNTACEVHLPPAVVADALAMWTGGFQKVENRLRPAMAINGGRSGLDVGLFHRVEAEQKRLGSLAGAPAEIEADATVAESSVPSDLEPRHLMRPGAKRTLCGHPVDPERLPLRGYVVLGRPMAHAAECSPCLRAVTELGSTDAERIVIEDASSKLIHFRVLGEGLPVVVRIDGADLVVEGPGLDEYLERLDPDVWDPARARGDA